jgi:hypothetical protein
MRTNQELAQRCPSRYLGASGSIDFSSLADVFDVVRNGWTLKQSSET